MPASSSSTKPQIGIVGERVIGDGVLVAFVGEVGLALREIGLRGEVVHLGTDVVVGRVGGDGVVHRDGRVVFLDVRHSPGDLDLERLGIVEVRSFLRGGVGGERVGIGPAWVRASPRNSDT